MGHVAEIVVSYRRDDAQGTTGRLYDRLSEHFGREDVFLDVETLAIGEDYRRRITETIASAKVLLAIVGKHWLTVQNAEGVARIEDPADDVRLEIATALQTGLSVFPVLVDGAEMPKDTQLPSDIAPFAYRNGHRIDPARFHRDVDQLIEALERQLGLAQEASVDAVDDRSRELANSDWEFDVYLAYSRVMHFNLAVAITAAIHDVGRRAAGRRPLRVFHDEENLILGKSIWETLHRGLDGSAYLLLLASRNAAASSWIDREVRRFLQMHMPNRVLIALVDGDLAWDDVAADFDWARTTALPRCFMRMYTAEPRWLDLRWITRDVEMSLNDRRFNDAMLEVAAALYEVSPKVLAREVS